MDFFTTKKTDPNPKPTTMSLDNSQVNSTATSPNAMSVEGTPIASPIATPIASPVASPTLNQMDVEENASPNDNPEKSCNKSAVKIIAKMYPTQYKNSQGYYIGDYRVMIDSEKFPATSFDKVDLMLNSLFKDMINGNLKEDDLRKIDSKDLIPSYETEFEFEPIQYSDTPRLDQSLDASIELSPDASPKSSLDVSPDASQNASQNDSIVSAISTPESSPDASPNGPIKKGGQTKKKKSKRSKTRKNQRKQKK